MEELKDYLSLLDLLDPPLGPLDSDILDELKDLALDLSEISLLIWFNYLSLSFSF